MDLTLEQRVQLLGLTIAGIAALFFLGNYDVEGRFSSADEEGLLVIVFIAGTGSLVVTAVWTGFVILSEIRRDQEATGAKGSGAERTAPAVSGFASVTAIGKEGGGEGGDKTPVTQIPQFE